MKSALFLVFCAYVTAQLSGFGNLWNQLGNRFGTGEGDAIDNIHGWRLEYHYGGDHHILLFINDNRVDGKRYCYVIPVDSSWEPMLKNHTDVEHITEEIYTMLHNPDHHEEKLTITDIATHYHHLDAARECRGHDSFTVDYTPSFM